MIEATFKSGKKEKEEYTPSVLTGEDSTSYSPYYEQSQLRPYNPAEVYQQRGNYDLYDSMRQDDQIASSLQLKKMIILNSEWVIESEDDKIKDFLTRCLNDYMDEALIKIMYNILTAMDYGFSLTEKIVKVLDTIEFGTKWVFANLKTRAPHGFELYTDNHGNMTDILQHTDASDININPKKMILYSYNKDFDNPYGNSEMNKGVYRAWWSKDAIIRFWNMYLEQFGNPLKIGSLPRSAGRPEQEQLLTILKRLQATTAMTIPEDFKVELLEVSKGTDDFERAISKYDLMIARSFLILDLMGFSGSQVSGGSYALGKKQFDIFYTTVEYIRNDLTRILNREIIYPLVFWNFGSRFEAKFRFNPIDDEKKNEDMKLWLEAVKTGKIPVTDTSINWFLEQVNAPEITDEELAEIQAEKDAFKEQLQNGQQEEGKVEDKKQSDKGIDKDNKAGDDSGSGDAVESKEDFGRKSRSDLKRIEKGLDELDDKYISQLGDAFRLSINAALTDIKRQRIIENKRFDKVNKIKLKHTAKILKETKEMMSESYAFGESTVDKVKKYAEFGPGAGLDNEDVAEWIKNNAIYVSTVEDEEIVTAIKGTLIDSIRAGDGLKETMGQLNSTLEKWNTSIPGGGSRIELIVRTNTAKAFNEARLNQFQDMAGYIQGYEYNAVLDTRTTELCRSLDGKVFPPGQVSYYNPPLHFRCRSIIEPIFVDEEYEESKMPATKADKNYAGFIHLGKEK